MTNPGQPARPDVRMRGFAQRAQVTEIWQWLRTHVHALPAESVATVGAAGRVLAEEIVSQVAVPSFPRAMMDGYAVRASETSGASPYSPLPLEVVDEALAGRPARESVQPGQAIRSMTGALLPPGADAVVPVEYVREERADGKVWVLAELTPGKHVAQAGDDVAVGQHVLPGGRRLRPQDLGVLVSLGITQVSVVRQPVVRIVVTGDELVPPGATPREAQIVDSNSPMLVALVQRDGGIVRHPGIVRDDPPAILAALEDNADAVLVSGGSSVGQEDHAPRLVATHGQLVFHGVAMRPSSPAGLGRLGDRLVVLLPGNPVSCLCAYDFFAGRAIRLLGGRAWDWPYRPCRRRLRHKLVSTVGRVDYARVRLVEEEIEPLAISGASILSSTTRADGFVVVPEDSEGYAAGTEVDLYLYDD
ncbi:MAG: molybdopterin molybdotransferase MoeA [Pirellulaceae bacterium]|jgi:molybdopterin molybdotransferase|nr:molybdopterin molybdotransferase MoeA [Pirellulaceae bacterium]